MRRLTLAPLAPAGLAVLIAACTAATPPAWTFEPPPPVTPAPSASAGPSGSVAPSESAAPSASASAEPSGPTGQVVKLAAQNIAYDQSSLTAPAGQPFTIEFANQDAGVPHNVAIKDASGMVMFRGDIFSGVDTRQYQVPALPAGTYTFFCEVHPNMTGTLTVQ